MVEFKDNDMTTTPGRPRESRDTESAAVADLVTAELDDANLNLNVKRLPTLVRIYGTVVLLNGLITLPTMVISIFYTVHEILDSYVRAGAMSLALIPFATHAVVSIVSAVYLTVFGMMLLRSHHRYVIRWTYVLIPLTLAGDTLSLTPTGLDLDLPLPLV